MLDRDGQFKTIEPRTTHCLLAPWRSNSILASPTSLRLDPSRYAFDPSSSSSKPTSRPAPCYPASAVLSSLLTTVAGVISSTHFHWNEASQRFVWAGGLSRSTRAAKANAKSSKSSSSEGDQVTISWKGGERIRGWSQPASDSVVSRFLHLATHLRRLESRVQELRNVKDSAPEAHALGYSLETVLNWIREELRKWAENVEENEKGAGIVMAWKGLEESEVISNTLAEMMSCSYARSPPYKAIPIPSSTTSILSHLHSYLLASISSYSSLLLQAILSYLLQRSSQSWRMEVASWIGFPGSKSTKPDFESQIISSSNEKSKASGGRAEPWSGVEVEWGKDERGEEDLGYVLRPSKLPQFMSTSNARDLLEAGRALRLLKKAAPTDHPLLTSHFNQAGDEEGGLTLPSWIWNDEEAETQLRKVGEKVKNLEREIARWRRRRGEGSSNPASSDPPIQTSSETTKLQTISSSATTGLLCVPSGLEKAHDLSSITKMISLFDSSPGALSLPILQSTASSTINLPSCTSDSRSELLNYLVELLLPLQTSSNENRKSVTPSLLPPSTPSLPVLTKRVFMSPLLQWSSLVNSALISVFFRDLGLGVYLETCRQFLLLGSYSFSERVRETLFDGEGFDQERDQIGVVETGRNRGIGLSRKLNDSLSWPPEGTELTSALMSAVVETVGDMRVNDTRRAAIQEEQGLVTTLTGTTVALKDLDERLSFAISRPERRKGDSKKWEDPQSIEALDWLTLSFFPPPLISPLLTQHASMTYQRIFNFLLRVMRVQAALRGLSIDITKRTTTPRASEMNSSKGQKAMKAERLPPLPFEDHPNSRRLLLRFKHEAQHFHNCLGSFVSDIAVNDGWEKFQSRLTQLSKDAEARDDASHPSSNGRGDGEAEEEQDFEFNGQTEMEDEDENPEGINTFELKDVFSLARYHERVLDQMLQTCFLKARQRGVMKIITDLQQITLDLAQLVRTIKLSPNSTSTDLQRQELERLHSLFYSRFSILMKALSMLRERSSGSSIQSDFEKARLSEIERNQREFNKDFLDPNQAAKLETERQKLEIEMDLKTLEGNRDKSTNESVNNFITRLDVLCKF